jgi:hypothetical protein
MYIREVITKNKKTNKPYVNHRLVESVQTEKGPRQRVIMNLGSLILPKEDWPKLARILEARLAGQSSLFEEMTEIADAANKAMEHYHFVLSQQAEKECRQESRQLVTVDLYSVTVTEARSLGPELVAHTMIPCGTDWILTAS